MCVDNPREGFGELFDTHPSVHSRVEALVKFAGGHDPGPLSLPAPDDKTGVEPEQIPADGAWGTAEGGPAATRGAPQTNVADTAGPWGTRDAPPDDTVAGPWGPHATRQSGRN